MANRRVSRDARKHRVAEPAVSADRTLGRGPVMGILMGAAAISFNMGGDQRGMQAFGQRMAQRIELARDRAIQNNQNGACA